MFKVTRETADGPRVVSRPFDFAGNYAELEAYRLAQVTRARPGSPDSIEEAEFPTRPELLASLLDDIQPSPDETLALLPGFGATEV